MRLLWFVSKLFDKSDVIILDLCCVVTVAGRKLNVEDVILAKEVFSGLLDQSSEFINTGGEPFASVGEFIRTEVSF